MSLHPIFAQVLDAHAAVTKAVTPPDTYRGWSISFDYPPIPCRDFDWSAISPDYDCDGDSEGFHQCAGAIVHGSTRDAVIEEIDNWFEEQSA